MVVTSWWVQIPPGAKLFRCRYKKIHLFPAKYRPYAFLLWADTRNVVAPSPARTVWVQIPPCANFSGVGIRKYTFSAKYRPYAFLLCADTRNVVAPSPTRTVWVQIPPGANFFRSRYKKIHIFRPNIAICLLLLY